MPSPYTTVSSLLDDQLSLSLSAIFQLIDGDHQGFITQQTVDEYLQQHHKDNTQIQQILHHILQISSNPKANAQISINEQTFIDLGRSLFSPNGLLCTTGSPSSLIPQVFLGGTCGSSDWRVGVAIPHLMSLGVSYYNPQAVCWSPALVPWESLMKVICPILLFVISGETRGITSMIEAAEKVGQLGRDGDSQQLIIAIEDVVSGVHDYSESELKDLNRGRAYLRECCRLKSIPTYHNAAAALQSCAMDNRMV